MSGAILLHSWCGPFLLNLCVDWIRLVQNRDQWWDFVNAILQPSGSMKGGGGNFSTSE
jgi:hypothetical protein